MSCSVSSVFCAALPVAAPRQAVHPLWPSKPCAREYSIPTYRIKAPTDNSMRSHPGFSARCLRSARDPDGRSDLAPVGGAANASMVAPTGYSPAANSANTGTKMRCETCQGSGKIEGAVRPGDQAPTNSLATASLPCPDCGGSGIAHCCEGLREQPSEDLNGL